MYAWTNFTVEFDEWGRATKTLQCGDEITRDDLKVDEREWEELINVGAVREQPYPDIPPSISPREYFNHLEAKQSKGDLEKEEVKEIDLLKHLRPAPDPITAALSSE